MEKYNLFGFSDQIPDPPFEENRLPGRRISVARQLANNKWGAIDWNKRKEVRSILLLSVKG